MVAGGREGINEDNMKFFTGAGAIVIDYLTTKGEEPSQDIIKLKKWITLHYVITHRL